MEKVLSVSPDVHRGGLRFEVQMKGPDDAIGHFTFQLLIRDRKYHPMLAAGVSWRKSRYALFRNWEYQSVNIYDLTLPEQLKRARDFVARIYETDHIEVRVHYESTNGGEFRPFKAELPYRRKVERLHRFLEKAAAEGLPRPPAKRGGRARAR